MELLNSVILAISCVTDLYISHKFFSGYFHKRTAARNKSINVVIFVIFASIQFSIHIVGKSTLNLLIIPMVLLIYLVIIFDAKPVQELMYFIVVLSVLLGCEFLFVVISETTNKDSSLYLASMPWQTFTIKLMSFTILTIIKHITGKNKNKLTDKIFWLYICIPLASLGMMFVSYFIGVESIESNAVKILLTILFVFMLVSNIVVFSAFNRYEKTLFQTVQQDWIVTKENLNRHHYKKISSMYEKQQMLIHDFKYYLSGLRAVANEKSETEIMTYLDNFESLITGNETDLYSNIPFLDTVLSEKKEDALQKGVSLNIQVEPRCSLNGIRKMDYVVMLGNLMDNAIQASEKGKLDFNVFCNIFMKNNGAFLVTKIQNKFNPQFLKIKDDEFISSKNDDVIHGVGIKSVKAMASECGGMLSIDIQGNLFTAILVLPTMCE